MGEIELLTLQTAQVPFEWIILRSLPEKCKMFLDSKFESWLPKSRQFEGHLIHLFKEYTGHACSNLLRMGCFNISFLQFQDSKSSSLVFPFRFLTTKQPSVESFLTFGCFLHLEGPEPRRVTCVAVKIPPLPYGPLSVAWFSWKLWRSNWIGSRQVGWLQVGSQYPQVRKSPKGWWKGIRGIPPQNPLRNYSPWYSVSTSDVIFRINLKICQLKILGVSPFCDLHDAYNPHKALHVISLALGL